MATCTPAKVAPPPRLVRGLSVSGPRSDTTTRRTSSKPSLLKSSLSMTGIILRCARCECPVFCRSSGERQREHAIPNQPEVRNGSLRTRQISQDGSTPRYDDAVASPRAEQRPPSRRACTCSGVTQQRWSVADAGGGAGQAEDSHQASDKGARLW